MALYPFVCRACGYELTREAPVGSDVPRPHCPECIRQHGAVLMARVYSFSAKPAFEDHYSHATGQYVASRTALSDAMKAKNEEMTLRTGYEQKMEPVNLREVAARSIDGETLDMLRREHKGPEPFPKAMVEAVEKGKV
jgi:hypothetical protein